MQEAAGVVGVIPALGRPTGGGNGNPLQYSCLEKSMDRGTWWAIVRGVTESDMTEWLSTNWYKESSLIFFLQIWVYLHKIKIRNFKKLKVISSGILEWKSKKPKDP